MESVRLGLSSVASSFRPFSRSAAQNASVPAAAGDASRRIGEQPGVQSSVRSSESAEDIIIRDIIASKQHTDKAKGKDIVILIGDTGIGKSTLANALVYGVESLEAIPIYEKEEGEQFLAATIIQPKVQMDGADGKPVLREGTEGFVVGHSLNQSQTSYPLIELSRDGDNIAFADCPGYGDSKGKGADLVNCVAINNMLKNSNSVRILVAVSDQVISGSATRGSAVKNIVETLSNIFGVSNLQDQMASVIPIVTQVPINKGYPEDKSKVSVKSAFRKSLPQEDYLRPIGDALTEKLQVVDCMDRDIRGATKIASLKEQLRSLPTVESRNLSSALTPSAQSRIRDIERKITMTIDTELASYQQRVSAETRNADTLNKEMSDPNVLALLASIDSKVQGSLKTLEDLAGAGVPGIKDPGEIGKTQTLEMLRKRVEDKKLDMKNNLQHHSDIHKTHIKQKNAQKRYDDSVKAIDKWCDDYQQHNGTSFKYAEDRLKTLKDDALVQAHIEDFPSKVTEISQRIQTKKDRAIRALEDKIQASSTRSDSWDAAIIYCNIKSITSNIVIGKKSELFVSSSGKTSYGLGKSYSGEYSKSLPTNGDEQIFMGVKGDAVIIAESIHKWGCTQPTYTSGGKIIRDLGRHKDDCGLEWQWGFWSHAMVIHFDT